MQRLLRFLALTILLLSLPTSGKGQSFSQSVIVVFQDGVELELSDWTFEYEYGQSYVPPVPRPGELAYWYHPRTKRTTDLLLGPHRKPEGGFTSSVKERIIPSDELSAITFAWPSEDPLVPQLTIRLTNGEIIKVDKDALEPRSLLSSADYVFGIQLYLVGHVSADKMGVHTRSGIPGIPGWFRKRLSSRAGREASETIIEIRFQASPKQQ
jgi:hypothetical protein